MINANLSVFFRLLCILGVSIEITSCTKIDKADALIPVEKNVNVFTQYVNPFIGTGGHGHTFPGSSLPNGMVQLSPDTRLQGWDACSGYHITDQSILGFSHTHLSGTGIGDYGDVLFMPFTDPPAFEPDETGNYSHNYAVKKVKNSENAVPGYYSVNLENGISVELTSTLRAGFHRYTFDNRQAGVVIDLNHTLQNHKQTGNLIEIVGPNEIRGVKKTQGWARVHEVYFHAVFSMPFEVDFIADSSIAQLNFKKGVNEVLAKVGISYVDMSGAKRNLDEEIVDWNFEKVKTNASQQWNDYLSKIELEGGTLDQKTIFYTAMYHAALAPNIFSDGDGRYMGMDREIHQSDRPIYTVYSLWDTFRALHPFNTIIRPSTNTDMIHSLMTKYEEGGILPKWELAANYTGTMTGYHSSAVIVDAFMKGQRDFDVDQAYEALVHASGYDSGLKFFDDNIQRKVMPRAKYFKNNHAYIPSDSINESVSKALEYAYNDWCIAQMAKELDKNEDYEKFLKASRNYKEYFDNETGFMRGKTADGDWREPFDPKFSNHRKDDYVEGNAWQWSWFVPHDVLGLIDLYGGTENFNNKLDQLFSESSDLSGENVSSDISGLIGQYAHGNEPSHHIAYLFNYAGKPEKTQKIVEEILTTQYANAPDGLSGNEDCGQMSAWYLMSSLGFYQVAPGKPEYALGKPIFDKAILHLENGKDFIISKKSNDSGSTLVRQYRLNGTELRDPFITHEQIESGATLEFLMYNME